MSHVHVDGTVGVAREGLNVPGTLGRTTEVGTGVGESLHAVERNQERMVELLSRALAAECSAFHQYWHHYTLACDANTAAIREFFKEHANQEYEHAGRLLERMGQLAETTARVTYGIHQVSAVWYPFPTGHDLPAMISADLAGEHSAIALYKELSAHCDEATRGIVERLINEECQHAHRLSLLLGEASRATVRPS